MSLELIVLAAASLWGFLQLVAAAQAANAQYGLKWAASPATPRCRRSHASPGASTVTSAITWKRFRSLPRRSSLLRPQALINELTHWGSIAYIVGRIAYTVLYISGIPLIRSLFWNIAAFGMLAVLGGAFRAALKRAWRQLDHFFSHTLYRSRTRSRLTMTRTGKPGRIVSVGWMLRLRRTTCWPL